MIENEIVKTYIHESGVKASGLPVCFQDQFHQARDQKENERDQECIPEAEQHPS
jgi:hypothetical protein